jgi:sRNA-binding protein
MVLGAVFRGAGVLWCLDYRLQSPPMRHQQSKAARRMRAKLRAMFPNCFRGRGQLKWPLKSGIGLDLAQRCPDLNYHHVQLALADYTTGRNYLLALTPGAIRRDLDGKPAGLVSATSAAKGRPEARSAGDQQCPASVNERADSHPRPDGGQSRSDGSNSDEPRVPMRSYARGGKGDPPARNLAMRSLGAGSRTRKTPGERGLKLGGLKTNRRSRNPRAGTESSHSIGFA